MPDLIHESARPLRQSALKRQIRQLLLSDITSGQMQVGDKLRSIHELSRLYNVSTTPIRKAILELEAAGYLIRRHGSGTFIQMNHKPLSMANTVMLCIEARAHLYGELNSLLVGKLLSAGLLPAVVDIAAEEEVTTRLTRALASDARFFVVHGNADFNVDRLVKAAFPDRHVLGVISWETQVRPPNLHCILSDYAEGGRLVARHLWAQGHRRVLMMGTASIVSDITSTDVLRHRHGWGFAQRWKELGGSYATFSSGWSPGHDIRLNEPEFMAIFRGGNAPTAIFGLRDLEAWHARTLLLKQAPALAASMEMVGHGNTPWSQASNPPFSTVDLNLEEIADHTMLILEKLLAGEASPPDPKPVHPRLILR